MIASEINPPRMNPESLSDLKKKEEEDSSLD